LLGRETLTVLEHYRADKAFLGSSGFTAERGHSTPDLEHAQIKEAIIRASEQTYVLVDSSKYGHNWLSSFTRLRDVALTITDSQLARSAQKALKDAGAKLRIAD
jgi:DeoR/GlpR family transcriptional regulator of sugar metabolism